MRTPSRALTCQIVQTWKADMSGQQKPETESVSTFEKREELRRVLESKHFANAPRKRRFLEFVTEQTLQGNGDKLNEFLIGAEVYGRGSNFNPQDDPIVRVQAYEIRRILKKYYDEEGKENSLRIEMPLGHYIPAFSKATTAGVTALGEKAKELAAICGSGARWHYTLIIILAAACAIFAVLWIRERSLKERAAQARDLPRRLPEELEWFWKPFLPPADPPIIVLPNHPLLRAAHDGDSAQTLANSHEIPKKELPEFRDTMHFRELKRFLFVPNTTGFTAVGETMGLANLFQLFSSVGQKCRLQQSRLVTFEEIKRSNVILLGGNQSWSGRVFLNPSGFRFQASVILNKDPRAGE